MVCVCTLCSRHLCPTDVYAGPAVFVCTPLQCICAWVEHTARISCVSACLCVCLQPYYVFLCEEHSVDVCMPLCVSHLQCLHACAHRLYVHLSVGVHPALCVYVCASLGLRCAFVNILSWWISECALAFLSCPPGLHSDSPAAQGRLGGSECRAHWVLQFIC